MSLEQGTPLGSYTVLAPIGAGGMGEVYRARDTKLGRDVAIKVLPEILSKDKERLARFGREARVLASLNHPNIAAIYGLEDSDGVQFIVLELVDGETLAERIARGPIPIDEALPLFKQITEALEAAHEKGIIHRDLKPANVKVTSDGRVKVLDFGLAKAFSEESSDADQSESPTATYGATRAGVIMGTASYMSPEQARGKALDKRTDIWSFGCVLYEALTGKKPFAGETVTDTIANIVRSEPDWNPLPVDTPWKIRELLARCLRKDPARRLHDIADVRLDIEDAASAGELTAAPAKTVRVSPSRSWVIFLAGLALATAVTAIVTAFLMRPEPDAVRRLAIPLPPTDVQVPNHGAGVALSPDGSNLVYIAERDDTTQLFLRPMDQLEPRPLPATEGAHGPTFSPDGHWIGFWANGQIKKIPIAGGLPTTLCDSTGFMGAFWASDDRIYFSPWPQSGILRVASSGGSPEKVTALDSERGEINHSFPAVLPSGKAVLFNIWSGGDTLDLAVQLLERGERKILVPGGLNARTTSTGHIIYAQAGSLLAAPFDSERLEFLGSPSPVLEASSWMSLSKQSSIYPMMEHLYSYQARAPYTSALWSRWIDKV